MYAYKDVNNNWVGPVNMRSEFKGVKDFNTLTTVEQRALGWYPCIVINYKVPYGTTRSATPDYYLEGTQVRVVYHTWTTPVETIVASIERAVDIHLNEVVRSLGYDSVDSIAKYICVPNSQFRDECLAIGDWIDQCWVKCHTLFNQGTLMTEIEVINELPEYVAPQG